MRAFGFVLIAIGVVGLLVAFNLDTSVETSGGLYGLPSRVENIGLIAQRQNYLFVSGLITLIGVLLAIFGGRAAAPSAQAVAAPRPTPVAAPDDRDLTNDAYRLWLANAYEIMRNEVFDRFVIREQTFGTLDDALAYAHSLEVEKIEAVALQQQQAEEARQRYREQLQRTREEEEAQWERNKPRVIAASIVAALVLLVASPFIYRWAQEAAERHRQEEAATLAQLKKDIDAAGLQLLEGATDLSLKEVSPTDDDHVWCDDSAGTLLTYSAPAPVKDVVKFYDTHFKSGRDKYEYIPTDDSSGNRVYEDRKGRTIELYVLWLNGRSSVDLCKLATAQD